ncbi:hypothetical protein [Microbulbifer aggregans]|uniref:hypothetical protein n=1 Tax=Microbulbifer aggregans TaxID=1769779 RepID=UPI001CFC9AC9|nr:hypothetical protein [Microbulbifer aggregans]
MIFPERIETEEEIILRSNMLGFAIGFAAMAVAYILQSISANSPEPSYTAVAEVVFLITGYAFFARVFYLIFVHASDIRKAVEQGLNIHVSGSAFSLKKPLEHRYSKSEILSNSST